MGDDVPDGAGAVAGWPAGGSAEERLRSLHTATYPDLLRFVERRLPADEAEDVVAKVFIVAWQRLDDVPRASVSEARAWLFTVARNTMANHARASSRRAGLDVRVALEHRDRQEDCTEAVSTRIDLARVWSTLRARDREVLALVAFDGLDGREAALVLGCRRSTVAMRLTRARHRLRQALGAPQDADGPGAARAHRRPPGEGLDDLRGPRPGAVRGPTDPASRAGGAGGAAAGVAVRGDSTAGAGDVQDVAWDRAGGVSA